MKFLKSGICLMMSLCLMACNPASNTGSVGESSVGESETETQVKVDPFYIYCNDKVTESLVNTFVAENPKYEEVIQLVGMNEEDFATFLATALEDVEAENYPDMVVLPKELKDTYLETEHLLPIKKLGIGVNELANMYPYMVSYGTDSKDNVKALSWADTASVFVYRISLAEEYLGITTQEAMEDAISTWEDFAETANNLAAQSKDKIHMIPELQTVKTLLYNGNPDSWYPEGSKEFVISDFLMEGIMAYQELEESLTWNYEVGSTDWYKAMSDGSTLGFFGSSYFVETILAENCGKTAGDWAICRAPSSYEFDGVWLSATQGCADKELAEELLRYMTMEEGVLENISATNHIAVNHTTLMETLSAEEGVTSSVLHEGGMLFYYLERASVLDEKEKELNDLFWTEAQAYWDEKVNLEQLLVEIENKIK